MAAADYEIRRTGRYAIMATPPEIDATNADEIRQALLGACDGAAILIIDMSETTFCDSAGLRAIITAQKQAAATGTQFRLAATALLRILTITGVERLIPVYSTLAGALAECTRPPAEPPLKK